MLTKFKNSTAEVWSQTNCPACSQAKQLLERYQIQYVERMIGVNGYTKKDLIDRVPDARSVPQIFIDSKLIGGLNELKKLLITNDNNQNAKVV